MRELGSNLYAEAASPHSHPQVSEAALRATDLFKAKDIYRDNSGQVTGVAVINSGDIAMAYFPDLKHCQKAANEQ